MNVQSREQPKYSSCSTCSICSASCMVGSFEMLDPWGEQKKGGGKELCSSFKFTYEQGKDLNILLINIFIKYSTVSILLKSSGRV